MKKFLLLVSLFTSMATHAAGVQLEMRGKIEEKTVDINCYFKAGTQFMGGDTSLRHTIKVNNDARQIKITFERLVIPVYCCPEWIELYSLIFNCNDSMPQYIETADIRIRIRRRDY